MVEIFMQELASCSPQQIEFINEIVSWNDKTKIAFKLAKRIFDEDTDD